MELADECAMVSADSAVWSDGSAIESAGSALGSVGAAIETEGRAIETDGTAMLPDGSAIAPEVSAILPDGSATAPGGSAMLTAENAEEPAVKSFEACRRDISKSDAEQLCGVVACQSAPEAAVIREGAQAVEPEATSRRNWHRLRAAAGIAAR